jgi:hypothetical protein
MVRSMNSKCNVKWDKRLEELSTDRRPPDVISIHELSHQRALP